MLLSCVVEVSFTRKRVHARMIVSSVNIVFEDSRGAQVGYTGALCTLLSAQRSTAPRTLILLWDRAHVTLARLANAHSQLSPCMITLIARIRAYIRARTRKSAPHMARNGAELRTIVIVPA